MSFRIWCVALLMLMIAVAHGQGAGIVKEIVINGNQNVSKEAILAAMTTKVGQTFIQANLDADQRTLMDRGFFQAVDVQAKPLDTDWQVVVNVVEYPVIKEIRVTGNNAIATDEIIKAITVQPGQVYNLNARNPSQQAIVDLYAKKGYFAVVADFAPLRESPSTLNVQIVEATVASVTITGNNRTKDYVIQRLIRTRPGEPYNINKWASDMRRLYGTQWFESIDPHEEQVDLGKIALSANVVETRTGMFNIGLQMDPRSSFAGFIRVTDPNFRGTGQSVGASFLQTTNGGGPSLDLDYVNPFMDSRNTTLSVSLYSRLLYRFTGTAFGGSDTPTDNNRYNERRTGASIGLSREFQQDTFGSIALRGENVKTSNLDNNNTGSDFIQQDGDLATITFGYLRNKRDVDIDPSQGDWMNLQIEPGYSNITKVGGTFPDKSILGPNYYVKSSLEYRRYWSKEPPRGLKLDEPRHVLAFRATVGTVTGRVPFFEQFFAGGTDSIRGYQDDRFWGKNTLVTTLEYRNPIQKSLSLIGFVDYGGAWGGYGTVNDFSQSKKMDLHLGYGLGVGFKTPFGPIRLDFGFDEHGKSRTHFMIGTSF